MPFLLFIAGAVIVTLLSWGSVKTLLSETAEDVRETASGQVLTIRERADALTQPVIERVDALDRRADSVQKGIEKLREGADLLREGVAGEE